MHEAERNIWCMTTLGVPVYSRRLRFFIPEETREEAGKVMASGGKDCPWVLLNPGAGGEKKIWPLENFVELGFRLVDALGVNLGVTGYSETEQEAAARICGAIGNERCGNFSGEHHITRLGALVERSILFVSNDTGPLHVASAVGTPSVGLYLPQHLSRFGPWGNIHRCLAAKTAEGHQPMRTICVEDVFDACMEIHRCVNISGMQDVKWVSGPIPSR